MAIPALEEAVAALNTIKPTDINEIKALTKPPVCPLMLLKKNLILISTNVGNRKKSRWCAEQCVLCLM